MLVFVDESGDAGLKLQKGSSKYFVVTLVVFEENEEAEACDKRIDLLKEELAIDSKFEFKFNKCKRDFRERFLKAVSLYNFFYFVIVINKRKLTGSGFRYKSPFYKYATSLVFKNAKTYLNDARVTIDGSGSKDFKKQLEIYLRKKINKEKIGRVSKIKIQASGKTNLLQLADMVSGAIYRSFGTKEDARVYRSLIKHWEIYVQVWPK